MERKSSLIEEDMPGDDDATSGDVITAIAFMIIRVAEEDTGS